MLYNERFVLLHIPKTAGQSLTLALAQVLTRPLHCVVSPKMARQLAEIDQTDLHVSVGQPHENMNQTARRLARHRLRLEDLEMVCVVVRNPYDLMVSNYFFMREHYAYNRGNPRFQLAHRADFETYAQNVDFQRIEKWMTLDGRPLDNLRVLKFESLQEDLNSALSDLGVEHIGALPHLNTSNRGHFLQYLTPAAEQAIYEKLRYLFDEGYYARRRVD